MKRLVLLIVFFAIYSMFVLANPSVTAWDREVIIQIQQFLSVIPSSGVKLFDRVFYGVMIALPIACLGLYFIIKKKWLDIVFLGGMPIVALILNSTFKEIIQRPRPPHELQMIPLESYSYVSSHTLITFSLWMVVIYYMYKLNLLMKNFVAVIGILWSLILGFSRCWLGVHNPTDVIGGFIFGFILVSLFLKIKEKR